MATAKLKRKPRLSKIESYKDANIDTTEQSSWAPTSHVLVVNCEATKATISATIKAIPVHRYPLSPFEL